MAPKTEIWKEQEVEILRKYMQREETLVDVARAMDRTPMAVLLRVRRIIGIDVETKEHSHTLLYNAITLSVAIECGSDENTRSLTLY